jgi:hypothetical protein
MGNITTPSHTTSSVLADVKSCLHMPTTHHDLVTALLASDGSGDGAWDAILSTITTHAELTTMPTTHCDLISNLSSLLRIVMMLGHWFSLPSPLSWIETTLLSHVRLFLMEELVGSSSRQWSKSMISMIEHPGHALHTFRNSSGF